MRDGSATRRLDRTILMIVGLVLIAVSVLSLLLAAGIIDGVGTVLGVDRPILGTGLDDRLADHQLPWQLGVVIAGIAVALAGVAWLRRQLSPRRRARPTTLDGLDDGVAGTTSLGALALAGAVESDLRRHPSIIDAHVDMVLEEGLVRVRMMAAHDADVRAVMAEAVGPALGRMGVVAGLAERPEAQVAVRLAQHRPRNVQ